MHLRPRKPRPKLRMRRTENRADEERRENGQDLHEHVRHHWDWQARAREAGQHLVADAVDFALRIRRGVAAEGVGGVVGFNEVLDAGGGLDDDAAGRGDDLGAFAEWVGGEEGLRGAAEAWAGGLAFVQDEVVGEGVGGGGRGEAEFFEELDRGRVRVWGLGGVGAGWGGRTQRTRWP